MAATVACGPPVKQCAVVSYLSANAVNCPEIPWMVRNAAPNEWMPQLICIELWWNRQTACSVCDANGLWLCRIFWCLVWKWQKRTSTKATNMRKIYIYWPWIENKGSIGVDQYVAYTLLIYDMISLGFLPSDIDPFFFKNISRATERRKSVTLDLRASWLVWSITKKPHRTTVNSDHMVILILIGLYLLFLWLDIGPREVL